LGTLTVGRATGFATVFVGTMVAMKRTAGVAVNLTAVGTAVLGNTRSGACVAVGLIAFGAVVPVAMRRTMGVAVGLTAVGLAVLVGGDVRVAVGLIAVGLTVLVGGAMRADVGIAVG
jgi:hypothetical protein